jgi:spermidine/putrescine-binding protein
MWLVSLDEKRVARTWSALWDPAFKGKVAIWDDAVWAVTLAARDLGLSPVFDLRDSDLPQVRTHLAALFANECRTWRTPEDAIRLVKEEGVIVLDDWGIVSWTLRGQGRWVHTEVPKNGSALWIDSWMIASHVKGRDLDAARAWIAYALSPENQRDLLLLAGYDPTNSRTVRVLDKATALSRLRTIRERQLGGLQRWREVPRRQRYLDVWESVKER